MLRTSTTFNDSATDITYLAIFLNHPPNHVFSPGETIVGVVTLVSWKETRNPSITILLSGKVQTFVQLGIKYKESLFEFSQLLFQQSEFLAAGTHSWPFSFVLPSHYTINENKFQPNETFNIVLGQGKQSLPPSSHCTASSGNGQVCYKLKASSPGGMAPLKSKMVLRFSPTRDILAPVIVTAANQIEHTFRIGKDGQPRFLTVWEQKKRNHQANKVLKTWLQLDYSTAIILGDPFRVVLELKADVEKTAVPTFILKSFLAVLTILSTIRTPGGTTDNLLVVEGTKTFEVTSLNGKVMPLNTRQIFTPFCLRENDTVPSFKSSAVARSYKLQLKVQLTVMGRDYSFFANVPDIPVLPQIYKTEVVEDKRIDSEMDSPPIYAQKVRDQAGG